MEDAGTLPPEWANLTVLDTLKVDTNMLRGVTPFRSFLNSSTFAIVPFGSLTFSHRGT